MPLKYFVDVLLAESCFSSVIIVISFFRVAFVMKKHLNTHLLGKHGVGTPKER